MPRMGKNTIFWEVQIDIFKEPYNFKSSKFRNDSEIKLIKVASTFILEPQKHKNKKLKKVMLPFWTGK